MREPFSNDTFAYQTPHTSVVVEANDWNAGREAPEDYLGQNPKVGLLGAQNDGQMLGRFGEILFVAFDVLLFLPEIVRSMGP